jgi:hypothetical protein
MEREKQEGAGEGKERERKGEGEGREGRESDKEGREGRKALIYLQPGILYKVVQPNIIQGGTSRFAFASKN